LTNTGQGDFTATTPASVRDDLTGLLDDSVWAGFTSEPAAGTAAFASGVVTWSGPLLAGEVARISYAVELTTAGDGLLPNLAWSPADPAAPDPPGCLDPTDGRDSETGEPCARDDFERPILELLAKTVTPEAGAQLGDWLTYEIRAHNRGAVAFTSAEPALIADSLADLLDDVEPFDLSGASDGGAGGAFVWDSPVLRWTGPLAVGQEVTLTYKVRLARGGDGSLRNLAWAPIAPGPPPAACSGVECVVSELPLPALAIAKSAAMTTSAARGAVISYTITVTNVGQADYTADKPAVMTDDMSLLLDDASYSGDAAASLGTVEYRYPRLVWTGALERGASATITYSAVITAQGDGHAHNLAWVTGQEAEAWIDTAPAPAECASGCSTATVEVPGRLPVTGLSPLDRLSWGAAMIAVGAGLAAAMWRRRRRSPL
jgi:hypothetical protein